MLRGRATMHRDTRLRARNNTSNGDTNFMRVQGVHRAEPGAAGLAIEVATGCRSSASALTIGAHGLDWTEPSRINN